MNRVSVNHAAKCLSFRVSPKKRGKKCRKNPPCFTTLFAALFATLFASLLGHVEVQHDIWPVFIAPHFCRTFRGHRSPKVSRQFLHQFLPQILRDFSRSKVQMRRYVCHTFCRSFCRSCCRSFCHDFCRTFPSFKCADMFATLFAAVSAIVKHYVGYANFTRFGFAAKHPKG